MEQASGADHAIEWMDVSWAIGDPSAGACPELHQAPVHVFRASLAQEADVSNVLASHLSPDEMERARRYRFDEDRRRYVVSRGLLREVLGRFLQIPPRSVPLGGAPLEKPFLGGHRPIQFNLSHCADEWMLAVSAHRAVGIDIERFRGDADMDELMGSILSPGEAATAMLMGDDGRRNYLRSCWVVKEACLKATGVGLSEPMTTFRVPIPSPRMSVTATALPGGGPSSWQVVGLPLEHDSAHVAAVLVVEGGATVGLRLWSLHICRSVERTPMPRS